MRLRSVVALLAGLLLLTAMHPAGPPCGQGYRKNEACAPEVGAIRVTRDAAGQVLVIVSTQLLGSPDSARLTVTGPTTASRKLTTARTDTVAYSQPATPGDRISGTITVVAYKGGGSIPGITATWEYIQAGAAFTFQVKPASVTLSPSQRATFRSTGI